MALIQIFARPPVEGRVKTRLMADIGAPAATRIYRHCLDYTIDLVKNSPYNNEIWLSEPGRYSKFDHLNLHLQQGSNLGQRMFYALSQGLQQQGDNAKVILIGTDCIELSLDYFTKALTALEQSDLVFVPAVDGGFALIGCRKLHEAIFSDVEWGKSQALNKTIANIESCRLSATLLDPVRDVDTVDDLHHYPDLQKLLI